MRSALRISAKVGAPSRCRKCGSAGRPAGAAGRNQPLDLDQPAFVDAPGGDPVVQEKVALLQGEGVADSRQHAGQGQILQRARRVDLQVTAATPPSSPPR